MPGFLALLGLKDTSGEDLESKVDISEPMKKFFVTDFRERCGMAGKSLAAFLDNLSGRFCHGPIEPFWLPQPPLKKR
jgi:hypothetical protein